MLSGILACLPPHLHPVSAQILDLFLNGNLPLEEFRRMFSLPNSDYLPVTDCILKALHIQIPPVEL
jgi:hypothetical protein